MKTKITLSLMAGMAGAVLFTGCMQPIEYDGRYGDMEIVVQDHLPTPPKIQKHSIKEYKNMSFETFLKNIYAFPIRKYSTKYLVDCKTLSNNKMDSSSLCGYSFIKGRWLRRDRYWQKKINAKLDALINNDIKNELNKFCVAKAGFIEKDAGIAKCKINNKVFYQYKTIFSRHNTGLQIKYFKNDNLTIDDILRKHGAIKLAENEYDVSKVLNKERVTNSQKDEIYLLLASKYPELEEKWLDNYIFETYDIEVDNKIKKCYPTSWGKKCILDKTVPKNSIYNKIMFALTNNKANLESSEIIVFIDKKKIIAVFDNRTKHLFFVNDSMRKKFYAIIEKFQQKKKMKKEIQKEILDY